MAGWVNFAGNAYPVLGSSPTYTQYCAGSNGWDGSISMFDLTTLHSIVGIDEIKKLSNDVFVYPNPANDKLYVKITNFNDKYNYTVFNSLGQIVIEGKVDNYNNVINLNGLREGIYFLELTNGKERLSAKFIRSE